MLASPWTRVRVHELGANDEEGTVGALMRQRRPKRRREEDDGDERIQSSIVRPWVFIGERRRGVLWRGREVQEDGDDAVNLLDMLALTETSSRGGARARSHSARVHGMPERW